MKTLLILLLIAPMLGCSQDLGFWEGTPEQLQGCKNWRVSTTNESIPIAFFMTVTDCYGNEYQKAFTANGTNQFVCSLTQPTGGGALVTSVTQIGWCTDPFGSTFDFWVEGGGLFSNPFPTLMSEVYIYSADAGGTNRNLVYSTTSPQDIAGSNNSVIVNDTFTGQGYYVIRVRARRDAGVSVSAFVYVRPGSGQRITFSNTSFEYKELIIEKREFYLQFSQG